MIHLRNPLVSSWLHNFLSSLSFDNILLGSFPPLMPFADMFVTIFYTGQDRLLITAFERCVTDYGGITISDTSAILKIA